MRFVVRTFDDPSKIMLRTEHMGAHLRYLQENDREILVAGSLRKKAGADPIGALWIVEAETEARARQLVEEDPFHIEGLRANYEVLL
ncbi:YciI family protein [Natronospira elongata]|uniref:YciI family protein n=1 Tax=Natronospira elongata TaxID=3110268 RepID=UPI0035B5627D